VLLVPGWKDGSRALRFITRRLISNGWPAAFVTPIGFHDAFGSNLDHAEEIATAIDATLARTGAASIDVVAHSMGGLALRQYLRTRNANGDSHRVRRAIFLATPFAGTWVAYLAAGRGAREMRPGTSFLVSLPPEAPPDVHCHTLHAHVDTNVVPASSTRLAGAVAHPPAALTHRGLLRSDAAFRIILAALLEV